MFFLKDVLIGLSLFGFLALATNWVTQNSLSELRKDHAKREQLMLASNPRD